ncbi:MAG: cytochrome c oxidase assembly protein [Gammaproteobacteria bacterium]|nr:cytochrome c oxidase assembly protein [Gammaproteobacteria bacterium]
MNTKIPATKNNKRLITILVCGVIFMFGFCYMLVPLYNIVCKQIGFNGKSANSATLVNPNMQVDTSRTIKVDFSTTMHGNLNFKFIPLQRHIEVHPGERKLIYFYAENKTGKDITVQAIPSITPNDAARFLKKTECFCFTQQYFFKGEKADMPVYFFIDPAVPKETKEMTLSYTLFDETEFIKKQKHFTKGRIDL